MTSELRERLRIEIDAEKRRRMTEARGRDLTDSIQACKSCGGDHDLYTKGCVTCTNRRWNRTRRKNAARRALENQQQRERRNA
jgi:hypothetical protein